MMSDLRCYSTSHTKTKHLLITINVIVTAQTTDVYNSTLQWARTCFTGYTKKI